MMAEQVAPRFLGTEFNSFLFAPVGVERSGGQLSVVSALARLDLDAWAEAAVLARLPRDAAVAQLSGLLRRFTEIPRMAQESGVIAARLIALLPRGTKVVRQDAAAARMSWSAGLAILVALSLVLAMEYASLNMREPVARMPAAHSVAPAAHVP